MSTQSYIYTGAWINHSRGPLLGATITLTTRDASFLLAFLALVVATAGGSFWRIFSYVAHQIRSKSAAHDALYYQQQAVLKNSGTALGAAWKFARVSSSWRKHKRTRWWQVWRSRTLFFIITALIIAAGFGTASIFSSQVTKAEGTEVLIRSPNCGFWEFPGNIAGPQWQLKILNETVTAANYARTCYGNGNGNESPCNTYAVPQINWTAIENAPCPFADRACLLSTNVAYQMDTGQLDSHSILGLDSKTSERVTLRKVATCAPLYLQRYATIVNQSRGDSRVDTYIEVDMGPNTGNQVNWTYEYNELEALVNIGYDFQTISSYAGIPSAGWDPAPDFNRTDADISLFFLAPNAVAYSYSNSDPIFSATTPLNFTYVSGGQKIESDYYTADDFVTALGCTDQYQLCNPNRPGLNGEPTRCTPLVALNSLVGEAYNIGMNDYQYATASFITISMRTSSMFFAVSGRGTSALKAQETVFSLFQAAQLPNNQWQIELSGWFAVSLASLQQSLVEYATGPANVANLGGSVVTPSDKYTQALCKRQLIRNVSGHINFSLLGVSIILILGSSLVLLGLTIDILVGILQKWAFKRHYARLTWISDGYLQLQRLAYEGAGYDGWEGCEDEVPVSGDKTHDGQVLGPLNIIDATHPRLVRSDKSQVSDLGDSPVLKYGTEKGLSGYQGKPLSEGHGSDGADCSNSEVLCNGSRVAVELSVDNMRYASSDGEGMAHLDTGSYVVAPTIEEGRGCGIGEQARDGDK